MEVKVIEHGVNDRGEEMYIVIIDYGIDVKSLKLTRGELRRLSKSLHTIVNDMI